MAETLILHPDSSGLVPVWLLWVQYESGNLGLKGIATSKSLAVQWKKTIDHDPLENILKSWIDPSQLDHLYASNMTNLLKRKNQP